MPEVYEKVKISELPDAQSYDGLYTVGARNGQSVKVPMLGVTKPPIIGNDGYWYVWSLQSGEYVKTDSMAVGKSAYQQAVEGGYQGTEQEFMYLLAHAALEPIWVTEEEFQALVQSGQIDPNREYRTYEEEEGE